jgi:hypothetical protein
MISGSFASRLLLAELHIAAEPPYRTPMAQTRLRFRAQVLLRPVFLPQLLLQRWRTVPSLPALVPLIDSNDRM